MRLDALHLNTPLLRAAPGLFPQAEVWLKMDALQPSGSFKLRGVGRLVQQAAQDGAREIVCASAATPGLRRPTRRARWARPPPPCCRKAAARPWPS